MRPGSVALGHSLAGDSPCVWGGSLRDRRCRSVSSHPVSPSSWSCSPSQSPARRGGCLLTWRSHTSRGQTYCHHGRPPPNQASRVQAQGAPLSFLGWVQGSSRAQAPRPATAQGNLPVMERRAEPVSWYPPMSLLPTHATSWPHSHPDPRSSSLSIQSPVQQTPTLDYPMTTQTF